MQIGGVSTTESLWSKRGTKEIAGTQIDMIIERKDNVVNMCEMKFSSDDFKVELDYHKTLERRKQILREKISKKAVVHNTLVTTYGLVHNEYYSDFINVITMDDLFIC